MPNVNFKPMDVHKSPIPHLHIIQTSEEFISEVNGDKEISSKVMIMMQTKLTDQ